MQIEITAVGDLKRFLAPFVDETVIIMDYAKPFYVEYVLPTNDGNAYLRLSQESNKAFDDPKTT